MKISNQQALDLEIKINKSIYDRLWSQLGDILYKWRLNPQYYEIEPLSYNVTKEQLNWINKNMITDIKNYKYYTLLEE
tara:strand:- start:239 stop:472 length:234 start_codon:yes stop_codon:yes gene_type:complete